MEQISLLSRKEAGVAVNVRWMVRRDLAAVIAIEHETYDFPWQEEDFMNCLKQRNCIGMVAEDQGRIVGFMIYENPGNQFHLLNIATAREHKRQGVARQMVQKLVEKLISQRRNKICAIIRETNLDTLLFFRSVGFQATTILKNYFESSCDDAYVMQYALTKEHLVEDAIPVNRIADRVAG